MPKHRLIVHIGSPSKRSISIFSVLALILAAPGIYQQAFANQLDALLLPEKNKSNADFAGVRFIDIRYSPESKLASLLNGKNERVEFNVSGTAYNSSESVVNELIQIINGALLTDNKSPTMIENATLKYVGTIKGYDERVQISYRLELRATLVNYVLLSARDDDQPAIVDLDWRNFAVSEPLFVNTNEYGIVNVNYPIGLLELLFPDLARDLLGSEAKEIMEDPILNFKRFDLPMKSWHFLFDATGKQLKRYGVFVEGEGGTLSIHSIGESSFREGTYLPVENDASAAIYGGTEIVKVHASTPPPSGQISIAGYSRVEEKDGAEFALVSDKSPGFLFELGFQIQVLLVLGGMMGAIAVFVLLKTRK
jgi:hypothetical protein